MLCVDKFERNYRDVENLFLLHSTVTEGVQGRNRHLTPSLLKSSIILICACWETFVEDLCREGAEHISNRLDDPDKLPNSIKEKIAIDLRNTKNPLDIWKISGEKWALLYKEKIISMCDGLVGGLNTPNYNNVKDLLHAAFDIRDVKVYWNWQGMESSQAVQKLNTLVSMRGTLAHGGQPVANLNIGNCKTLNNHIKKLVEKTSIAVSDKCGELTGVGL